MNKKIVGFFIATLLLSTGAIYGIGNIAETSTMVQKNNFIRISEQSIFESGAEPPEWEIGDQWTYKMNPVVIDADGTDYSLDGTIEFEDLTLEVVDIVNDEYKVHFSAYITGGFEANIKNGLIKLSGQFLNKIAAKSRLQGEMIFRKSDLGIKQINNDLDFVLQITVNNVIPLRVPAEIELNIDFDIPLQSMEFPFDVGDTWGNPKITVSFDGEIRSKWLNLLNLIDRIFNILDPEISDLLLPVIDISDLIEFTGADSSFEIPAKDSNFHCIDKSDITVEAGTFQAYNIDIMENKGSFYYAPDAGMVIKISDLDLQEYIPFLGSFNVELSDTNYS